MLSVLWMIDRHNDFQSDMHCERLGKGDVGLTIHVHHSHSCESPTGEAYGECYGSFNAAVVASVLSLYLSSGMAEPCREEGYRLLWLASTPHALAVYETYRVRSVNTTTVCIRGSD